MKTTVTPGRIHCSFEPDDLVVMIGADCTHLTDPRPIRDDHTVRLDVTRRSETSMWAIVDPDGQILYIDPIDRGILTPGQTVDLTLTLHPEETPAEAAPSRGASPSRMERVGLSLVGIGLTSSLTVLVLSLGARLAGAEAMEQTLVAVTAGGGVAATLGVVALLIDPRRRSRR